MKSVFRSLTHPEITTLAARHDADEDVQHALAELLHLREQRDRLQAANTALLIDNRALSGQPVPVRLYVWPGHKGPDYKTAGAAGADCLARLQHQKVLLPGEKHLFPLGFAVELPVGWEIQVRARSGLANAYGIAMVNAPGTVDSDYRGEVCANLINLGTAPWIVEPGDRIAQVVIAPARRADWQSVKDLSDLSTTQRGAGGHGSTGR